MDGDRIGILPDLAAGLAVAEGGAAVLDGHPLDPAGEIGLPVFALGLFLLGRGQVIPPAQFLQKLIGEFRIAVFDLRTLGIRPLRPAGFVRSGPFPSWPGTPAPLRPRICWGSYKIGVPGCFISGRPPTGPGESVIFSVAGTAFGLQGGGIEGAPVFGMEFETLRALAGITDGPGPAVELTQDVFDQGLIVGDLDMFAQFVGEPQFFGQLV